MGIAENTVVYLCRPVTGLPVIDKFRVIKERLAE
jgi:hypothetical protein